MKNLIIKTLLKAMAFYSGSEVETVTISTKNGPVRINKSDFNEKEHKLHRPTKKELEATDAKFTDEEIGEKKPETSEPAPVPSEVKGTADIQSRKVMKNGKRGAASKWIVVNSNGTPVDELEYDTEKEAWDAALAQAQPANNELQS